MPVGIELGGMSRRRRRGGAFVPYQLFANNEPGGWYEPSDNTTLFQNAAGTTPVTGVEQAVGLMLDKSKGLLSSTNTGFTPASGAGHSFNTPDSVANSITGDIDIRWYGYTILSAAGGGTFCGKWGSAGQQAYAFDFAGTAGALRFYYTSDGSTSTGRVATSSVTPISAGLANNVPCGLRATYKTSTGEVLFYYDKLDGLGWVQLGATQTITSGAIFDTTGLLYVNDRMAASVSAQLNTSRLQIYNGINGTLAVDFDPTRYTGGTTFIAATGEVWTLTGAGTRITPSGNHVSASADARRPILRARYNLLTNSAFDGAATGSPGTAPTGWFFVAAVGTTDSVTLGNNASNIVTLTASASRIFYTQTVSLAANQTVDFSVTLLANNNNITIGNLLGFQSLPSGSTTLFLIDGVSVASSAIPAANSRITLRMIIAATAGTPGFRVGPGANSAATGTVTFAYPSLVSITETGNLPYQRTGVNASTGDYDTAGFPPYLAFDGVDDCLFTAGNVEFATWTGVEARRNLLLVPSQFDATNWVKAGVTVDANTAITLAPDGSQTADKMVSAAVTQQMGVQPSGVTLSAAQYTFSCYLKAAEWTFGGLTLFDGSTYVAGVVVNLTTGVFVTQSGAAGSYNIADAGNGWWRVSVTGVATANPINTFTRIRLFNITPGAVNDAVIGDGTSGIYIWGAQLELGTTATAFQNVGTDQVTVVAGVRKLSDAAQQQVVELSIDSPINTGSFDVSSAVGAGTNFGWRTSGSVIPASRILATGIAAPATRVLTGVGDIASDTMILRANASVAATGSADQGTGNFRDYPLYIGARANASLRFSGRLYGLIVRGLLTETPTLEQSEAWMNQRTQAY